MPTNNRVDDVNTIDNCRQGQQRQWPRPSPHRHRSTIVAPATRATCHHNHNNTMNKSIKYRSLRRDNKREPSAEADRRATLAAAFNVSRNKRCLLSVSSGSTINTHVLVSLDDYAVVVVVEKNNQPCQRKPSSMRAGLCSNRWIGPCVNRSSPQRTLSTAYLHTIISIDYEVC